MDGTTLKRKVTVAKLTPGYNDTSPATSRPSSRNSARSTSRPASPSKSFISASSPLATRPKAKVNSSAVRRTSSSNTAQFDSSPNSKRPSSPVKFSTTPRIRGGALSPPSSAVGVGTRKPTVVRVKPSVSVSSVTSTTKLPSPEFRNRSLTASSDHIHAQPAPRKPQGGAAAALHHAASYSNLQPPSPCPSPGPLTQAGLRVAQSELGRPSLGTDQEDVTMSAPQPVRIRSKVTSIAKNVNDVSNTPPAPNAPAVVTIPTTNTNRPITARVRAGSISSNVSSMSTAKSLASPLPSTPPTSGPIYYPITTATPAANPHRYATARSSPASGLRTALSSSSPKYTSTPGAQDDFRPFAKTSIFTPSSPNANTNGYSVGSGYTNTTMVDPVNVPLPPHSPPISSLSISSRSSASVSRSSISYIHEPGTSPESSVSVNLKRRDGSPQSPHNLKNTLDTLVAYTSAWDANGDIDNDDRRISGGRSAEEDKERKVKDEAKSNRKIADLEITNRSLLAINASLEKTKDRQAKEIRELKRKLRESRLILPPQAYRAIKSSLDPEEVGDDEEDVESGTEESDFDEAGDVGRGKADGTYKRIKVLIDNLLDSGKRALEETKEDYMHTKGNAKVLTAEEVEFWRGSAQGGGDLDDIDGDDNNYRNGHFNSHSPTPEPTMRGSVVGLDFGNPNLSSSSNPSTAMSSPKPPPILITGSP